MELPRFGFVAVHRTPLAAGIATEAQWLARSAELGQAGAHLWTAPPGLVVPRRYTALPGFSAAAALAAAGGVHGEVQVRSSGGGLVPQGPGVWNLSLTWPAPSASPSDTEAIYRGLCEGLARALARLGVNARPQGVDGSFCDGRYNLATGGAKVAGTAQAWRRVAGVPMVLAHAVIIVSADPAALTARANAFEAALGTATRYREDAVTSVARAAGQRAAGSADPSGIEARALVVLAEEFARLVAPHVHEAEDGSEASNGERPW